MKLISPPQFVKALWLALAASLIFYFLFFAFHENAKATTKISQAELKCISIDGTSIDTYKLNSDAINWYSDTQYVIVDLPGRKLNIPQHRCEMTEFK